MNRLFVAYKPPFITSNALLSKLKQRYRVKKAGFSGTLDPFACGTLIIAFGAYTKLFRFLKKYPKRYRATLWLGAKSKTLDIEGIETIDETKPLSLAQIERTLLNFKGQFTYTPPLFSAKKIGGRRAYQFAHKNKKVELPQVTSTVYNITLITYRHPFLTFEAEVSEGTYIRSLGEAIAKKFGYNGTLSYLERLKEGAFIYDNERPLDPLDYLISKPNETRLAPKAIFNGKKLQPKDLLVHEDGLYHLVFNDFFAIIEIKEGEVRYLLNQIPRK